MHVPDNVLSTGHASSLPNSLLDMPLICLFFFAMKACKYWIIVFALGAVRESAYKGSLDIANDLFVTKCKFTFTAKILWCRICFS